VNGAMNKPAQSAAKHVNATPYPWPFDGSLRPDNTALVIIDMQTD
jgi:hypothetical protein